MKLTSLIYTCLGLCLVTVVGTALGAMALLANIESKRAEILHNLALRSEIASFAAGANTALVFRFDDAVTRALIARGAALRQDLVALADDHPDARAGPRLVDMTTRQIEAVHAVEDGAVVWARGPNDAVHGPLALTLPQQVLLSKMANHGIALGTLADGVILADMTAIVADGKRGVWGFTASMAVLVIALCGALTLVLLRLRGAVGSLQAVLVRAGETCTDDESEPPDGRDELGSATAAIRRLIDQRTQAEKRAANAELARTAFILHVSHELRTPLNAILGYSEMMRQEYFGPLGDPRYRDYANDVNASGAQLSTMVDRLIELAQLPTRRQPAEVAPTALAELARAAVRSVTVAPGPAITEEVEDDPVVTTVPPRARQAIANVLQNAVDHAGTAPVAMRVFVRDGAGCVAITNSGATISATRFAALFEPFSIATDGSIYTARTAGRLGIGLALTKALMDGLGARIDVASTAETGTTVTLSFPLATRGESA